MILVTFADLFGWVLFCKGWHTCFGALGGVPLCEWCLHFFLSYSVPFFSSNFALQVRQKFLGNVGQITTHLILNAFAKSWYHSTYSWNRSEIFALVIFATGSPLRKKSKKGTLLHRQVKVNTARLQNFGKLHERFSDCTFKDPSWNNTHINLTRRSLHNIVISITVVNKEWLGIHSPTGVTGVVERL